MRSKSQTRRTNSSSIKTRKPGSLTKSRSYAIYGPAGTGKTTLAGTFPGPVLLIDMNDRGDDSVAELADKLEVVDVSSEEELEDIYWELKSGAWKGKFSTVIIDTVTQLQQIIIEELVETKGKKSRKFADKNAGDWGTMTKQDWGTVSSKMKKHIVNFRNLPVNMVFLAQQRVFNVGEDDEVEFQPEVGPSLSPATASYLASAMHVVGNTFIRRKIRKTKNEKGKVVEKRRLVYCLGIGPSELYIRKVRKPRDIEVMDVIENPTYEDIIEIIQGE